MKIWRYRLEAAGLYTLFALFKILPPALASATGGFLSRTLGMRLAASRKAYRNLDLIFPDKSRAEKKEIVRAMWDNLGRVFAEYPHLETIAQERIELVNEAEVTKALAKDSPIIFISAHCANWELCGAALYARHGESLELTYRVPNNPYVDGLLTRARTLGGKLGAHPKSRETARKLVKCLQEGKHLGILYDQKFNTGIKSPFLGRLAMTNPGPFQLAQKFGATLLPVFCERLPGCRFRMHVFPPIETAGKDTQSLADEANDLLSQWIEKHPGQWLWIHRRWKSKALETPSE